MNIYVIGHSSYGDPMVPYGDVMTIPFGESLPEDAELVVFTGGEDISPSLYGEENTKSYPNPDRDKDEVMIFNEATRRKLPLVGICRGMQLFTALTGGKLWQHVQHHTHSHSIKTIYNKDIIVNSLHHQACRPNPADYISLARSYPDRIHEAGYFPSINALGVQFHPEMMYIDSEGRVFFNTLLEEYLNLSEVL